MKLIDLNKAFTTREGKPVTVLTDTGSDIEYPIVGEVEFSDNGDWLVTKWKINGECIAGSQLDLVNEVITIEAIVLLVRDTKETYTLGAFRCLQEAELYIRANKPKAMIVGSTKVKLIEGEFEDNESISYIRR